MHLLCCKHGNGVHLDSDLYIKLRYTHIYTKERRKGGGGHKSTGCKCMDVVVEEKVRQVKSIAS